MDNALRELHIARICSGSTRVTVSGPRGRDKTYLVKRPSRDQVYVACELYLEVFRESELTGLYSDEDLMDFLLDNGFWDEQRSKALELIPKQIEDSKVALYRSTFKSGERKVIRKALALAKAEVNRLLEQKNAYGYLSCSGAASMARARYLIGVGLHTVGGAKVFPDDDEFWRSRTSSSVLDEVISGLTLSRLDESAYRELARTDPWRSTWNGHKVENSLFGVSPADWTDEMKGLVNWSLLYDNVHSHPDCPPDTVIDDDDLMDGWLILQRREREQRVGTRDGEQLVGNEKIRGSQEVYLVADSADDARKVVELNDDFGKAVQKQRFNHLKAKGEVNELEMPDTALRLRTEVTAKLSQSMNARRS